MNMMISIVIPVYGVSAYIERCINSVMSQTYGDIECIIIDDATPDDSIEKCEYLIADYHGPISFKILHHRQNRGLSAARNTGMEAATGEYVLFLDGDDELMPDSIKNLVEPVMKDDSIEMVVGNVVFISDGCPLPKALLKRKKRKETYTTSLEDVRKLYFDKGEFPVSAWNKLIKREFLRQYELKFEEGLLHEDRVWTHFMMKHLCRLCFVSDVTYRYYVRPNSISTAKKVEENKRHFSVIYNIISNNLTEGEKGRETKHYLYDFCGRFLQNPKCTTNVTSADRFKMALLEAHYLKEARLLSLIILMSRSAVGRGLFWSVLKARKGLQKIGL